MEGGGGDGMSGEWTARTKDLAKALHLQAAALRNVRIAALAQLSELQVDEHALERLLAEEEGREGQGGGAAGGKGGAAGEREAPPAADPPPQTGRRRSQRKLAQESPRD